MRTLIWKFDCLIHYPIQASLQPPIYLSNHKLKVVIGAIQFISHLLLIIKIKTTHENLRVMFIKLLAFLGLVTYHLWNGAVILVLTDVMMLVALILIVKVFKDIISASSDGVEPSAGQFLSPTKRRLRTMHWSWGRFNSGRSQTLDGAIGISRDEQHLRSETSFSWFE